MLSLESAYPIPVFLSLSPFQTEIWTFSWNASSYNVQHFVFLPSQREKALTKKKIATLAGSLFQLAAAFCFFACFFFFLSFILCAYMYTPFSEQSVYWWGSHENVYCSTLCSCTSLLIWNFRVGPAPAHFTRNQRSDSRNYLTTKNILTMKPKNRFIFPKQNDCNFLIVHDRVLQQLSQSTWLPTPLGYFVVTAATRKGVQDVSSCVRCTYCWLVKDVPALCQSTAQTCTLLVDVQVAWVRVCRVLLQCRACSLCYFGVLVTFYCWRTHSMSARSLATVKNQSVNIHQRNGVVALWHNSAVQLYLPRFVTPQKTKLHWNVNVMFWKCGGEHGAHDNATIAGKD